MENPPKPVQAKPVSSETKLVLGAIGAFAVLLVVGAIIAGTVMPLASKTSVYDPDSNRYVPKSTVEQLADHVKWTGTAAAWGFLYMVSSVFIAIVTLVPLGVFVVVGRRVYKRWWKAVWN